MCHLIHMGRHSKEKKNEMVLAGRAGRAQRDLHLDCLVIPHQLQCHLVARFIVEQGVQVSMSAIQGRIVDAGNNVPGL